jgi:hypothetical protein
MLIGYCFIMKACVKGVVIEKQSFMVLSIKYWVRKNVRPVSPLA